MLERGWVGISKMERGDGWAWGMDSALLKRGGVSAWAPSAGRGVWSLALRNGGIFCFLGRYEARF